MLLQVGQLFAVGSGFSKRQPGNLFVGDLNIEAVAYFLERLVAELFLLVGGVQAFARLAHAKPLDGFRQDHGGRALVRDRGGIGCIDFLRIMTAAIQVPNLLVGHIGDHFLELGVFAEKMLARVGAALGFEVLVFAVHALFHQALEQAF